MSGAHRLNRELCKTDQVAMIVEGDREMAKEIHAPKNEGSMFAGREHASNTQNVWANFEMQPSAIRVDATSLNTKKCLSGTLGELDAQFSFCNGSRNHRAVGARVDEKVKR